MLVLRKIAITGALSSGKTSACSFFASYGAYVVSADEIVHQVLSPATEVGRQVIALLKLQDTKNHSLNRREIAQKVFSSPELLSQLEDLLHPVVHDEIRKRYQESKTLSLKEGNPRALFVAEVPLLYESLPDVEPVFYDAVVVVLSDPDLCRQRFQKTHPIEEYEKRMARQLPQEQKAARADYLLVNHESLEDLQGQVASLYPILLAL